MAKGSTWVCTNRCAVNSSSSIKVDMQSSLSRQPRTMETDCGQWSALEQTRTTLKKVKFQDSRKGEIKKHQNQKHPQKSSLGILNSFIKERDNRDHFRSSKRLKILPSIPHTAKYDFFFEPHHWVGFQNTVAPSKVQLMVVQHF